MSSLRNYLNELTSKKILSSFPQVVDCKVELCQDSRFASSTSLFFSENLEHLEDAFKKGCRHFVTEKNFEKESTHIFKAPARKSFALLTHFKYGNPHEKLKFIGITGTNGKTTTTWIVNHLLNSNGIKTCLIGTIEFRVDDIIIEATHTTPDPESFAKLLNEAVKKRVEYVVMEVSSHALDQDRVFPILFDHYAWTNFTQDHLDYHHTMEEYFKAKLKLFTHYSHKIHPGIIGNKALVKDFNAKGIPFVFPKNEIKNKKLTKEGIDFTLDNKNYTLPLLGEHNLENFLIADELASQLGLSNDPSIWKTFHVPGRTTLFKKSDKEIVVVDYAHTPDALKKLMTCVKEHYQGFHKILLFGCGGNRDKSKRPIMGEFAEAYADEIIITNDNPRDENPLTIAHDILNGIKIKSNAKIILDREEAIKSSFETLRLPKVIVVAGKGHERTIEITKVKVPFSDLEFVKKMVSSHS